MTAQRCENCPRSIHPAHAYRHADHADMVFCHERCYRRWLHGRERDPSPAEIEQRSAEVRVGWTNARRAKARTAATVRGVAIQRFLMDETNTDIYLADRLLARIARDSNGRD